jgi:hypothetical protein
MKTFLSILIAVAASSQFVHAQNLIFNGDFESGNTGFTSGYTYSTFGQGTYTITTNPNIPYPSSLSFGDHTTGSGNMFTADGFTAPNVVLWATSVPVPQTTAFSFSGWNASWGNDGTGHDPSPAVLQLLVNDVPIGTSACPSEDRVWFPFSFEWFSGSASTANLKIIDLNTAGFGNDPCVDDLSFSPVPEPAAAVSLLLDLGVLASRRSRKTL